jgi:hypothetical protein
MLRGVRNISPGTDQKNLSLHLLTLLHLISNRACYLWIVIMKANNRFVMNTVHINSCHDKDIKSTYDGDKKINLPCWPKSFWNGLATKTYTQSFLVTYPCGINSYNRILFFLLISGIILSFSFIYHAFSFLWYCRFCSLLNYKERKILIYTLFQNLVHIYEYLISSVLYHMTIFFTYLWD